MTRQYAEVWPPNRAVTWRVSEMWVSKDKYAVTVQNCQLRECALIEWRYFQWPWVTPYVPPNHPIFHIWIPFHIFVVGGVRDFKFGRQVDSSKFQPKDDKTSLKRRGQVTWTI